MNKQARLTPRMFFRYLTWAGIFFAGAGCTEPESIGRFRATPVTTIILDSLGVADEDPAVYAEAREVGPEDLIPIEADYVIGSGDFILVVINDLFEGGIQYRDILKVNETGRITLPLAGTFLAGGLTELELTEKIQGLLRPHILREPIVSVVVTEARKKVYSVSGAVAAPGTYQLWESDYRLARALAQAGGMPQANADYAFVIRRALRYEPGTPAGTEAGTMSPFPWTRPADMDIRGPQQAARRPVEGRDPAELLEAAEGRSAEDPQIKRMRVIRVGDRFELAPVEGFPQMGKPPVQARLPGGLPTEMTYEQLEERDLVQEVIRIDLKRLRGGDWRQNIVIRPGDDIHVPFNAMGVFNVMGQVARPGAYNLAGERLTLKQAIATAGPLTALAWPSRAEIIRRVGENKQITCRVNLEKLFEGASPDYFIKPNDIINVGSHPVARWVAVVRQSFRSTYGFGFVYDRNFADKDFGR